MTNEIKNRINQIRNGEAPSGYEQTKLGIIPVDWDIVHFKDMFKRVSRRNTEGNQNVLTISAQQGLINQEEFFNKNIASENKSNYFLLKKGEFAYNKSYSNGYPYGAIKKLSRYEKGVVSPLYICFASKQGVADFYLQYFENGLMNSEIKAIAQEGARNHGLLNMGIDDFFNTNIVRLHNVYEQQKIAEILTLQDRGISLKDNLLTQKKLQKKALIQHLFSGKIKLSGFDNNWNFVRLKDMLVEKIERKEGKDLTICSVSVKSGVIDQIAHLGRSYAGADTSKYNSVSYGDIVYTKSPTGDFPFGIIKQSYIAEDVAVSPLYGVYKPISFGLGYILHSYFESSINTYNYLIPIVQKGAKNTINISNQTFISNKLYLPTSIEEQNAIAEILSTADREIELLEQDLAQEKLKKKALMQLLLTGIVRVV